MRFTKSQAALETLQQKSANAVNIIRTTIDELKAANSEITEESRRNIEKIASLQSTNSSLDELRTGNEKIIANFEALLS